VLKTEELATRIRFRQELHDSLGLRQDEASEADGFETDGKSVRSGRPARIAPSDWPVLAPGLVATLPSGLVAQHAKDPALRIVRAPADIQTMAYVMVWHPRLDNDPAHQWLRERIRVASATF
jgi:DNA-binding transcriptional LysR family regulator